MQTELMEVAVGDLKIGDEWHDDRKGSGGSHTHFVNAKDGVVWKVVNSPIESTNAQLFWDSITQACVVVPVEYMDGARGSRLFDPDVKLVIRRDVSQKD